MLQQETADDYVISTGEQHSVREFCDIAFSHVGLKTEDHVVTDPRFFRPAEVNTLLGDSSKAQAKLGWQRKVDFQQLVTMMVEADLQRVEQEIRTQN